MLDNANVSAKPVQISINEELLQQIDADPDTQERGRSAVIRDAIRLYLRTKRRREIDHAIRLAYAQDGVEMLDEVQELIGAQVWPSE